MSCGAITCVDERRARSWTLRWRVHKLTEVTMDGSVMRAIARAGFIICILATTGRSATATAEEQRAPDRMPDFSGTWTRDVKRSEKPFTGASTIVIEQTESEPTTRSTKDQARVERYR